MRPLPLLGLLLACAPQSQNAPAAELPVDDGSPPAVYNAILARYDSGVEALIVDDYTSLCEDLSLPQNKWIADTLAVPSREAVDDCRRRAATRLRVRTTDLRARIPIFSQRTKMRPEVSIAVPLLFLSPVGFSRDSTIAAVSVGMHCGGPVCGSNDVFWLESTSSGWRVTAAWNVSVS